VKLDQRDNLMYAEHSRPRLAATQRIVDAIQTICSSFTDDADDFEPVFYMETKQGTGVAPVRQFMCDEEGKALMAEAVIPLLVREYTPDAIAFIASAWAVTPQELKLSETYGQGESLADSPFRAEIVSAVVVVHGDTEMALAYIERRPGQPPTLSKFLFGFDGGKMTQTLSTAMSTIEKKGNN